MAAGAADLVDHILPPVAGYRQWTLSFPRWLRIRLLRDKSLVSEVLLAFTHVVSAHHRRRARGRGIAGCQTGAVTAIQRAGSFANANLHFHTLVPEGVWHELADGSLGFHPLPPPSDTDVIEIAARIVSKVRRLLARRDGDGVDDDPDALTDAQAEAVQLPMSLAEARPPTTASRRRCAFLDGFSLHADTSVDPGDRPALERLVRYLLRPLISADRLTARGDGRVEYRFRRPDPSGRTSWVTDGATWCRRLASLLPPRRSHTTRFHGVLASAHAWRSRVGPSLSTAAEPARTITPTPTAMILARRLDWAALLCRVFGDEVTRCPRCGDDLRVIAFITDPNVTAQILEHLGLRSDALPISSARAPPDDPVSELEFAD